jgi:ACT domain-containing protein
MLDRVVITVVGKDTVGIIARVCTVLSGHGINILDISQTIVSGFFNMMITDISKSDLSFDAMQDVLLSTGKEIGVDIRAQREEIFDMMHRV